MSAKNNKFLIVQAHVVLTPIIEPVIVSLDAYFEKANLKALVTSGLRDAQRQLETIKGFLTRKGLAEKYKEAMASEVNDFDGKHYQWQEGWSALLNMGVIINPPLAATCLMHTTYDSRDRFGKVINQTPHARGTAFDIGGGSDGINLEAEVMALALKDRLPGLLGFLKEHANNAVHCDCRLIKV